MNDILMHMPQLRTTDYGLRTKKGFTLIELLIYCGLTLIVVGLFGSIIVTITRIQSQQTAVREITTQADFVINTIKRLIRDSNGLSVTTNQLTVGTDSSSTNPTAVANLNGVIYLQEDGSPAQPLTTSRVVANELTFTDLYSGASEVVNIKLTLSFNTNNPQQAASQTLEAAAAPLRKNN